MMLYSALHHGELIIATLRRASVDGHESKMPLVRHVGSMFTLCVWAAVATGGLIYFADATRESRSLWVAGLAIAAGLLGYVLPTAHASLIRIAVTHRLAVVALMVLLIPVATTGARIEVGWCLLAMAFACNWYFSGSAVSRFAAPATWLLALLHLLSSNGDQTDAHFLGDVWLALWGTGIHATPILAWVLSIAAIVIAALVETRKERGRATATVHSWLKFSQGFIVTGGILWTGASIMGLPHLAATAWIIVFAWLLLAISPFKARIGLGVIGLGVLILAISKWALPDTIELHASRAWLEHWPLLNGYTAVAAMGLISLAGIYRFARVFELPKDRGRLRWYVWLMMIFVVAWAGTFEIERSWLRGTWYLEQLYHIVNLCWNAWWCVVFAGAMLCAHYFEGRKSTSKLQPNPWRTLVPSLIAIVAVKFIVNDSVFYCAGVAPSGHGWILLNPECLTAFVLIGSLALARLLERPQLSVDENVLRLQKVTALALGVAILLVTGVLEIDRTFAHAHIRSCVRDPGQAEQVAISIFCSLFAVMALVAGFAKRLAGLRYFALTLLAVTLLKVAIVDFAQVGYGYRVLSFMGLGALLLGTSVIYGKGSPKLLGSGSNAT